MKTTEAPLEPDVTAGIQTISLADMGVFTVVTASGSAYVLDTVTLTSLRTPNVEAAIEAIADPSYNLRKDGQVVDLVEIVECTVGMPMTLVLDRVSSDQHPTTRLATEVVSIVKAA